MLQQSWEYVEDRNVVVMDTVSSGLHPHGAVRVMEAAFRRIDHIEQIVETGREVQPIDHDLRFRVDRFV